MARPLKRSADYMPHSAASRNTPEAKALRARFGAEGYAVYIMLMELLCGSDEFTHIWDELNIELLAGDFGISSERLQEISTYMARLKMIEIAGETIRSTRLEAMLQPVLEKRIRMQKLHNERVSATETTDSAEENPQRKGKERKGKESNNKHSFSSKKEESDVADNPDAPHPAETTLINWGAQHTDWLRKPIAEFNISKAELDGGTLTGELRKLARYYLTKAKPHVRAQFETNPGEFTRNSWRDWLRNIHDRRVDKQQAAAEKKSTAPGSSGAATDELTFTETEIYAIAYATVGEDLADQLDKSKKLYWARKAPDKSQARERIQIAAKELQKSRAAPTAGAPNSTSLAEILKSTSIPTTPQA